MEPVKFTFDSDFAGDGSSSSMNQKIQDASDNAFLQGKEAGYSEAISSIEKNCEMILNNIQHAITTVMSRHAEHAAVTEKNATALVLAIMKKLAPRVVDENPMLEIENLVQECMRNNPLEPRLVIRVDEQMLPHLRQKIDVMQTQNDYHGQIVLVSENMGNLSDCRVEWLDGGAERDFNELMASIEETIEVFLNAPIEGQEEAGHEQGLNPEMESFHESPAF